MQTWTPPKEHKPQADPLTFATWAAWWPDNLANTHAPRTEERAQQAAESATQHARQAAEHVTAWRAALTISETTALADVHPDEIRAVRAGQDSTDREEPDGLRGGAADRRKPCAGCGPHRRRRELEATARQRAYLTGAANALAAAGD